MKYKSAGLKGTYTIEYTPFSASSQFTDKRNELQGLRSERQSIDMRNEKSDGWENSKER